MWSPFIGVVTPKAPLSPQKKAYKRRSFGSNDYEKKLKERREASKVGRAIAPLLSEVEAFETVEEKRLKDKRLDEFLNYLSI